MTKLPWKQQETRLAILFFICLVLFGFFVMMLAAISVRHRTSSGPRPSSLQGNVRAGVPKSFRLGYKKTDLALLSPGATTGASYDQGTFFPDRPAPVE
jgi:hypothetical protein